MLEGSWKEGVSLGLFHPNPVEARDKSQDHQGHCLINFLN